MKFLALYAQQLLQWQWLLVTGRLFRWFHSTYVRANQLLSLACLVDTCLPTANILSNFKRWVGIISSKNWMTHLARRSCRGKGVITLNILHKKVVVHKGRIFNKIRKCSVDYIFKKWGRDAVCLAHACLLTMWKSGQWIATTNNFLQQGQLVQVSNIINFDL